MKYSLAGLIVLLFACVAVGQTANESHQEKRHATTKTHILELERQWAAAEEKGDKTALDRLLATDYKFTDLNGKVGSKSEFLASVQNSSRESTQRAGAKDSADYDVQVYGDAAVVTHNTVFKGQSDDKDVTVEARGMDVWVKHGSDWQVVAHQWTVISGPRGEALPKSFLAACARFSYQPEVHSLYGDAATVLAKLQNDTMGLPDRRGYLLLVETKDSAELDFFERTSTEESKVYHWEGDSVGELREKLTGYILANRGIACVGAQTKALVNASVKLSDLGEIPTPLSASAAFSHMIKRYGDGYLRVTVMLLC
jgi:ketosteroid isomerase-like protein